MLVNLNDLIFLNKDSSLEIIWSIGKHKRWEEKKKLNKIPILRTEYVTDLLEES